MHPFRWPVYLSVLPIDARQVYLSYECDIWRNVRVLLAAMYPQTVDTVLMDALEQRD
jgi:hypothetical protein